MHSTSKLFAEKIDFDHPLDRLQYYIDFYQKFRIFIHLNL